MSEYTPTTEDVRQTWAEEQDTTHGLGYDAHADEFDRWLAAHDAEMAARTLREAAAEWVDEDSAEGWAIPSGQPLTARNVWHWLRARAEVEDVSADGLRETCDNTACDEGHTW